MEENNQIQEKISKVNGEIVIKDYLKGKLLGKGGFAKCFEITQLETKKVMAAKIIPKSSLVKSRSRQKLISEIKIHKSLHHTNIVQFEHVFEDQENVYILLELCTNQTLNELIKRRKRLHEIEVQCYIAQVIQAIKYLHANRVIHRDLKLGNLFLNNNMEIKLGDFGLATRLDFDEEKKRTICGTPNYIAPEILDDKIGHSYPVDVWSLGVIVYTLLIGKPPFETPDVKTTYKKIRMNNYQFPDHVQISEQAKNLIVSILVLDPSQRPTLNQILEHPFLSSNQIPKMLPLSTLACPPSANYTKQFQAFDLSRQTASQRFSATQSQQTFNQTGKINMISTERGGFSKDLKQGQGVQSQYEFPKNNVNQQMQQTNYNSNFPSNDKKMDRERNSQPNLKQQQPNRIQDNNNIEEEFNENSGTWVKQWVDYSQKYGLGYILNNGCAGVFFNDSTKIVSDPQGLNFQFFERKNQDKIDIMTLYQFNNYPEEMKKKVVLLNHFRGYLLGLEKKNAGDKTGDQFNDMQVNLQQPLIYVKKWMKTNHAIMFRLSNKIVQVNFNDKTEIHLSSEQKMVAYVNKKMERVIYPLSSALESNDAEMSKRLKYTKEILTHIYNQQSKSTKDGQMG